MLIFSQIAFAGTCTPGASGLPCPEQAVLELVDESCEYRLLHDLTIDSIGGFQNLGGVPYSVDNTADAADDTWSRLAVLMEVGTNYAWVSVDDFTGGDEALAGVSSTANQFVHQTQVTNMNVRSNSLAPRDGVPGNVEIWPYNYGQGAALPGIGGNPSSYDFNDQHAGSATYGSYQFHDFNAGETLFAFNRFNDGTSCDIGIGNQPSGNPDWTFAATCPAVGAKRLRIYLKVDGDDTCGGGGDLVETVVGGTSGFGAVLGSGPTRFDTGFIESRMTSLEDEWTSNGCATERWAGTQQRGRSPVLQGETAGGAIITGSSVSNGDVDGTAFSASPASGGRLVGTTAAGTDLDGYFARVSGRKSIWYGIESDCAVD